MMSSHYADFGRVLGRFALLPGEDVSTLISISNITDQGLTVSYSKSGGVSIVSDGEVVVSGHFDSSSRLFYFDIGDVLEYLEEEEMDETAAIATAFLCSYSAFAVADNRCDEEEVDEEMDLLSPSPPRSRKGRRGERIPQWLVAAIMDLHNRVGHPSAKVMSLAVSQRAWIGVHPAITSQAIDKVFQRLHCVACQIGKMQHLVVPLGSGVDEVAVADTLSYDIEGKYSPSSVGGCCFMFTFVCAT